MENSRLSICSIISLVDLSQYIPKCVTNRLTLLDKIVVELVFQRGQVYHKCFTTTVQFLHTKGTTL